MIKNITDILNVFYPITSILLTLLFGITIYGAFSNKIKISFCAYLLFILVFLFVREKVENNISFDFYLIDWLKLIVRNQIDSIDIVLINIFGNLILFVPLVFYINSKYTILWIILFIIGLELIQYITNRGVFDIVDIVLNLFGISVGMIIKWRIYGRQKKERRKTRREF